MGRPTKLSPQVREKIVSAVKAGAYATTACRAAGISESTFYRWLERGGRESSGVFREFVEAVEQAEAEGEVHAVAVIRRAMGEDWRAALAYLERRHPARWRRHQATELTVLGEGSPPLDLSRLSEEELALFQELSERATAPEAP